MINRNKFFIITTIIVLFFSCITTNNENPKNNYVILISFDGLRYDYTYRVDTPNFDYIRDNGVIAKSLKPIFPTFTFPNHYSIATGCYADKHKILGNEFYNFEKDEYYSYKKPETVQDGSWYGAEPIWVTAERQGINTATYFWVGSEAKINGYYPTYYKNYRSNINPEDKVDQVVEWLQLPISERPQIICLYFNEPDHVGHVFGVSADEVNLEIENSDKILGYLIQELKKINIFNNINIIIVSDHGMVNVSETRLINIDNYINSDDFIIDGKGPILQLRSNNKTVLDTNLKISNLTIYKSDNVPLGFHYKTNSIGDYLFVADEGWMMHRDSDLEMESMPVKGMHGYDPENINMHGIFYSMGPSFKNNYILDTFELIHIYPILCELLNISPYENSDGNIEVLNRILN